LTSNRGRTKIWSKLRMRL